MFCCSTCYGELSGRYQAPGASSGRSDSATASAYGCYPYSQAQVTMAVMCFSFLGDFSCRPLLSIVKAFTDSTLVYRARDQGKPLSVVIDYTTSHPPTCTLLPHILISDQHYILRKLNLHHATHFSYRN